MSDPHMNPHHNPENGGFERQDMSPGAVYGFLIVLAVVGIIVIFVVNVTYRGLDSYFQAHQPQAAVLKPMTESDPRATQATKVEAEIKNTFPQPLLETDERNELTDFRQQEAAQLNSYGWVDQKAGTMHIPIERAMQLIAQRGLPVHTEEAPAEKGKH